MGTLLDPSVLLRLVNASDASFPIATRAVAELRSRAEALHIAPQNLVEFRNSATRPAVVNGLGMTCGEADAHMTAFEGLFSLVPETPQIHPTWKALVSAAGVIGKQVHDARLTAICQVHGINQILSFNVRHFTRFSSLVRGLIIVDPAKV